MTEPAMPMSHAALAVDIQNYSGRNDLQQLHLQSALTQVLDAATSAVGLDRSRWSERQPQGDGEFAWLPPDVHLDVLVGPFIRELHAELGGHNRRCPGDFCTPIRLRVALHFGPVRLGAATGVAGGHAVRVGRLLDSAPVRVALDACQAADLALIVSDRLYDDFISQGLGKPEQYRRVRVEVKRDHCIAYVHVPGQDVHALTALDPFGADGPEPGDGPTTATGADRGPVRPDAGPTAGTAIYGDQISGASHRFGDHGTVNTVGGDQVNLPGRA
ncbi:hypothetical protein [Planomonospora parontospora]|uniref:hypothetical protein n=1 Tax=Planomonospora parontospora TaxID=58119 RepID=UPI00166F993B|nr:hypothetical protein [Planomonospora parontospora]GGL27947.1 hypothetical protein GCM10014719_31820 [Planomonospora parontospora subsp. antibiotica]GII16461.1 hypothetical protein Ppa05_31870 [Planomonospora parontospora subsp. antibiotica]